MGNYIIYVNISIVFGYTYNFIIREKTVKQFDFTYILSNSELILLNKNTPVKTIIQSQDLSWQMLWMLSQCPKKEEEIYKEKKIHKEISYNYVSLG